MKKIYYGTFLLLVISIFLIHPFYESFAQQYKGELSLLAGYQMLGSTEVYDYNAGQANVSGDLDINDAVYYSVAIGINTSRESMAEIQYIFQPTKISFDPFTAGIPSQTFDADVHYILGTGYYIKQLSRTSWGYGGLSLGAAGFVPKNTQYKLDPAWRVAFGLTLGAKFLVGKKIGIKIQAQGLFPIQWAGGSLYVGTGGSGYGVSAGTSIVQINVGGGLFYAF